MLVTAALQAASWPACAAAAVPRSLRPRLEGPAARCPVCWGCSGAVGTAAQPLVSAQCPRLCLHLGALRRSEACFRALSSQLETKGRLRTLG